MSGPGLAAADPVQAAGQARDGDPVRVAVVDYGAGNLVSIAQGLEAVGAAPRIVDGPAGLARAEALIVPGVGAAAPAMRRLTRAGLVGPIREWILADRPYLGICLGLQLLFEVSDEDGAEMFGVIPGRVTVIPDAPTLPHIGWNQVELERPHALFAGIPSGSDLYFVHSYAGTPAGPRADAVTLARTEHGAGFVSAVADRSMSGVQFHPERSGTHGLRLLENFARGAIGATGSARADG